MPGPVSMTVSTTRPGAMPVRTVMRFSCSAGISSIAWQAFSIRSSNRRWMRSESIAAIALPARSSALKLNGTQLFCSATISVSHWSKLIVSVCNSRVLCVLDEIRAHSIAALEAVLHARERPLELAAAVAKHTLQGIERIPQAIERDAQLARDRAGDMPQHSETFDLQQFGF